MAQFQSVEETRRLGAPIVRLFKVALARDPDPAMLLFFSGLLQRGATLAEVARDILMLENPCAPGSADSAGPTFAYRIAANVLPEGTIRNKAAAALVTAADIGMSQGDHVAMLAESPLVRGLVPVLPGLAPGAGADDLTAYQIWVEEYDSPGDAGLTGIPASEPRVTIVMAAGDMTAEAALRTLRSLQGQLHPNWELLLTVRAISPWPAEALAKAASAEPRLKLIEAPEVTVGSAACQQVGLASATGTLLCFLDPGDTIAPTALHEIVAVFAAWPASELVYSDEDVADLDGRRNPRFKPDFSPDLLLAGNSIGQLATYRVELVRRLGGLRPAASPFAYYDLAMRAAELAGPAAIRHLPAVLIHRAEPATDWPVPASHPRSAPAALLAVENGLWPRLRFRVPEPQVLVSVIVPTRDRPDLLAACTSGVLERTDYAALELILADNGTSDPDALAMLRRLEAEPRVTILRYSQPFNFAAINNAAASRASGEVLLLLNNDTEVVHSDWLHEMVSHAVRPDVGAVGARLLYPDGRVQHAGMLLGPAGAAVHVGRNAPRDSVGYDGQLACTRDLSAVTGACLALRRETFHAVGGMDERLAVTWNDVDLCLRVRAAGLRVIWTPHAVLLHREAVTRGLEAEDPAKLARFRAEQTIARQRWPEALENDPFLNPNLLATDTGMLVLSRPRAHRPWQA